MTRAAESLTPSPPPKRPASVGPAPVPASPAAHSTVGLLQWLRTDPWHSVLTVAIDVAAASASVGIATAIGTGDAHETSALLTTWLFVPCVVMLLAARSMYRRSLHRTFLDEIGPLETSVALATLMLLTALVAVDGEHRHEQTAVKVWFCAAVIMAIARLVRAYFQRLLRKRFKHGAPTLILGNGRIAHQLMMRMAAMPEYGLRPVGIIDAEAPDPDDSFTKAYGNLPYLGTPDQMVEIARATGAEEVIVAFSLASEEAFIPAVRAAHGVGIRVWVVPRMFDAVGVRTRIEHLGGLPLLVLPQVNPRGWQFAVKHVLDVGVTAVGLLIISPLMLTLALLVRLSSPGPIFFKQRRVGRDGQVFDCLKFRSMRPPRAADAAFELKAGAAPGGVEGVDRRTRIGKLMRATSLDELPQLINVVRGDMSLVGPRPERPEFVEVFEAQIKRYGERHRVKAGVTGWAQVHGLRGQTSITDRAEWDNYYVENWSLLLDARIIALTVPTLFRRSED